MYPKVYCRKSIPDIKIIGRSGVMFYIFFSTAYEFLNYFTSRTILCVQAPVGAISCETKIIEETASIQ